MTGEAFFTCWLILLVIDAIAAVGLWGWSIWQWTHDPGNTR